MRGRRTIQDSDEIKEINISPLIDMVFILLIFFIVTTVFVEEPGIDIVKPVAYNAQDLPKNVILIGVTESDNVFYGGAEVGLSGIRVKVRRLIRENSEYPVIIQADVNATNGTIARIIDECKLAEVPAGNIHVSMEKLSN